MGTPDEIKIREAQLVFASLQQRWDNDLNRSWPLVKELEAAESRLITLFMEEWEERGGDRKMMALAYSHYRKRLLGAFRLPAKPGGQASTGTGHQ